MRAVSYHPDIPRTRQLLSPILNFHAADGERLIAFEIAPATFPAEGVTQPERNVLPER